MSKYTMFETEKRAAGKVAWLMIFMCSVIVMAMSVLGHWPTAYLAVYIINLTVITVLTFHPRVSPDFQRIMMALITFADVFLTTLAEGELYPALLVFVGTTVVLVVYQSERLLFFYGLLIAGGVLYHIFIARTIPMDTPMDIAKFLMRIATLAYTLIFFISFIRKMNRNLAQLEELRRNLADRLEEKTREVDVMKDIAQQDALTGLWDRVYTQDAVNRLLAEGGRGALLMIDVDNFKLVNDNYGHSSGDDMLVALAETLRASSREQDVRSRLGGDEFMVYLKDIQSKSAIRARVAEMIASMDARIEELGFEVDTSISVGIAIAPQDGADFASLYSAADKALYYVKRNGKNSYHFFGDQLADAG